MGGGGGEDYKNCKVKKYIFVIFHFVRKQSNKSIDDVRHEENPRNQLFPLLSYYTGGHWSPRIQGHTMNQCQNQRQNLGPLDAQSSSSSTSHWWCPISWTVIWHVYLVHYPEMRKITFQSFYPILLTTSYLNSEFFIFQFIPFYV